MAHRRGTDESERHEQDMHRRLSRGNLVTPIDAREPQICPGAGVRDWPSVWRRAIQFLRMPPRTKRNSAGNVADGCEPRFPVPSTRVFRCA